MPEEVTAGAPEVYPNVPADVPTEARLIPPVLVGTSLNARRNPCSRRCRRSRRRRPEERGPSPHPVVRTGCVQDGVGSARPLRHAAQVVPVQQVHAAVLADLGHQVRVRGGAVAVRDRDGPPEPRSASFWSSFALLAGLKKSVARQVAVGADLEPDHGLGQGAGRAWCRGRASGEMPLPVANRI